MINFSYFVPSEDYITNGSQSIASTIHTTLSLVLTMYHLGRVIKPQLLLILPLQWCAGLA